MASLFKIFTRKTDKADRFVIDERKPRLAASLFYVSVILFIGVPMWFYTCSTTRYFIPDVASESNDVRLHLDISIVQLRNDESQTEYLRNHLPESLNDYNINWRVRRPINEEIDIFQSKLGIQETESELLRVHKSINRFRLFIYIINEQDYTSFCGSSRPHSYTLGFQRFVYLCPSYVLTSKENYSPVVNMITSVLDQVYHNSVDFNRVKQIISGKIDLLFSILPELEFSLTSLSKLSDRIHNIYDKNVRTLLPETNELVNIRFVTQSVIDILDEKHFHRLVKTKTDINSTTRHRVVQFDRLGELFHSFDSRLNKHSAQNVHNTLCIVPDEEIGHIHFHEATANSTRLGVVEGQDSKSLMIINDDKTLVLGMRAIIRRIIGLSSPDLGRDCLVRRDVFYNRWEVDAVMGQLTILKLQSAIVSLKSVSQQVAGIRIPKEMSIIANEAYNFYSKSIEQLAKKNTLESYRLACKAYELSELTFYDPSLLDSVYFPDELKYAIYLPLFLPLAFPFIESVFEILKAFFRPQPKIKVN